MKGPLKSRSASDVQRFDDQVPGPQFKNKHAELIEGVRKEIRQRHYSLRTEQAYEAWTLRFLAFKTGKIFENLHQSLP